MCIDAELSRAKENIIVAYKFIFNLYSHSIHVIPTR